jgi:trk system potassium uptake protein TrkA
MGADIESSVLCTILLRKLGVNYVVARADHDLHGRILERIGANRVVYPEYEMGGNVAHSVMLREVQDYMPLGVGFGMSRLSSPKYLVGRTLKELGFRSSGKSPIAVLVVQRGEEVLFAPSMDEKVQVGDVLILCGGDDKLEELLNDARKRYPEENGSQS